MKLIQKYYIHSLNYSRSRFIFEIASVSILLKFITGLFLGVVIANIFNIDFLELNKREDFYYQDYNYSFLIIFLGFIAPFVETFTQWIPISIIKKFTSNYLLIILFTAIIFASFHLSYSIFYAAIMLPLGIALSWSFYCKYKISLREAFFTTFAIHSIHNLITILFMVI